MEWQGTHASVTPQIMDLEDDYLLGFYFEEGIDVKPDPVKSVYWWTKAAEKGHSAAQYMLGQKYYFGNGVEQSFVHAAYWFEKAALQGDAEAQQCLAFMYEHGEGVDRNLQEALRWNQHFRRNNSESEVAPSV